MIKKYSVFLAACCLMASTLIAQPYSMWGDNDTESPIYQPGKTMTFSVKLLDENEKQVPGKKLTWKRTGDDGIVETGEGLSTTNGFLIKTSMKQPGFVRIYVNAWDENGNKLCRKGGKPVFFDGGACVAPESLKGAPEPDDFDEFWNKQKKMLADVPLEVLEMVEVEGTELVKVYDVKIACYGKMPVSGYLSLPKNAEEKSLPAVVTFHGYGVRSARKNTWLAKNHIVFDVNAHGIKNGMPPEYYKKLSADTLHQYALNTEKNSKHETVYFREMILRGLRALEFVKTLPEWNGKDLKASGGSQGGFQSLVVTGLDKDVNSCYAWSPWCCDIQGKELFNRLKPNWGVKPTPIIGYYDPVNFVKRANPLCKLEIIANLGDYTCPPSGVWIAFNNFPGPKTLIAKQGCEHMFSMKNPKIFEISK